MRRPVEAALRTWWGGGGGVPGALYRGGTLPLSWLYGGAVALRNAALDRGLLPRQRALIPVISVGNLAVGGAGKTPFTRWVVEALLEEGAHPAVVSRGYAEDEPALHRRWHPGIPVVSDPRRATGVLTAMAEGADVAVLDDGFQHRALRRDFDIVLLAAEHPTSLRLLPSGPYREGLGGLGRAHQVVITRRVAGESTSMEWAARVRRAFPSLPVARIRFEPGGWQSLEGLPGAPPEGRLLAVSGVASPRGFADLVRGALGAEVELRAFPDHHPFSAADVRSVEDQAGGRPIVMTEKDAVKWAPLVGPGASRVPVHVLSLTPVFEEGEEGVRDGIRKTVRRGVADGS